MKLLLILLASVFLRNKDITNEHRIFTTVCDLKSTEFPDNTTNYVTAPVEVNKAIK